MKVLETKWPVESGGCSRKGKNPAKDFEGKWWKM
jgi:hypothetical protein